MGSFPTAPPSTATLELYVDPDDETTKWTDESEDAVTWRRAHEVVNGGPLKEGDPKPKLFSGGIAPLIPCQIVSSRVIHGGLINRTGRVDFLRDRMRGLASLPILSFSKFHPHQSWSLEFLATTRAFP